MILPINAMSLAAGNFAYNDERARESSLNGIKELEIVTGDEIEHLYLALSRTTEDTVRYIADSQEKREAISHMQNGLITVLADMVESRDKSTGDHVRKTAAYANIIMKQLKKDDLFKDVLTDEFLENVSNFAPLHDVGKINIPDALLNKPGRLTDDEFARMKEHTNAGGEIIARAIGAMSSSDYLDEAKNLASYHHERWDGKGYPSGLSGEDIPLSARIMAVADVFDALVSRRSYKEPFSFDNAMQIIMDGSGSHFDPRVTQAFMEASEEVRRVAEEFSRAAAE